MTLLGNQLKRMLAEKGITQTELARRAGIAKGNLSHYIKGDRSPTGEALVSLACALNTTANHLMGKEDVLDFDELKRILQRNRYRLTSDEKAELARMLLEDA